MKKTPRKSRTEQKKNFFSFLSVPDLGQALRYSRRGNGDDAFVVFTKENKNQVFRGLSMIFSGLECQENNNNRSNSQKKNYLDNHKIFSS